MRPWGTHDTSRSFFSRSTEVEHSNSCARVTGCPATTKNFATCRASGLVLSCAILDLVWNSLALPRSESRTSRDPVVTRPHAATANARGLSADSCSTCLRSRASSVVRQVTGVSSNEAASKKRIGAKSLRNASDWVQWRKAPWSRLMHALPKR